jgi:hypothetical protein
MVDATQVDLQAAVIVRDDGRSYLDVVEAHRVRDFETEGLALIALDRLGLTPFTLTAADIRREQRFANSMAVWAYRMHPVSIEMRMRVLTAPQEDGRCYVLERVITVRDPAPGLRAVLPERTGNKGLGTMTHDASIDPAVIERFGFPRSCSARASAPTGPRLRNHDNFKHLYPDGQGPASSSPGRLHNGLRTDSIGLSRDDLWAASPACTNDGDLQTRHQKWIDGR